MHTLISILAALAISLSPDPMAKRSTSKRQDIDSPRSMEAYFMRHQIEHIIDESPLSIWEKSVRVGMTYADGFKQVRKRLSLPNRNYLFTTKDQPTAFEYIANCKQFLEIYQLTSSILTHGEETLTVPIFNEDGRDTGLVEEVRVGSIKFDNKSRILAFSSNPNAVRAYGGDVGWDEAAFHPRANAMYASIQGRVTWGYDLGIWSSHNGDSTLFCNLVDDAKAEGSGWSYHKCDIYDAIEGGLVEKINAVSGKQFTRETFLADCRKRAKLPGVFEQEYELKRLGGLDPIVAWERIAACQQDYMIERAHLDNATIGNLFGAPDPHRRGQRMREVEKWTRQAFSNLFGKYRNRRMRLGFDVAASGHGDLAAIYIDEKTAGGQFVLRALCTFRTEDWDVMQWVLWTFLSYYPGEIRGAGDETGLGRQICWQTAQRYGGRFTGMNFSGRKSEMGGALMLQLTGFEKRFPKDQPDIAADYYALRKTWSGAKWVFQESKNLLNEASHCDIAWAGALASAADSEGGPELTVTTIVC